MATKTKTKKRPIARTRVETLPELPKGVKIPTGYTPAYFRKRQHLAVLRADKNKHYLVFDIETGKRREVKSTNAAAILMSQVSNGEARLNKAS